MTLVDRLSGVLDRRLSRRSFVVRSAFVGSALSVGGADFLLTPGAAYASICSCGYASCDCDSTCCAGYTEFCCVINGGYNYCPSDTVMGGWWKADGSIYCDGPRYYMDCNATCSCTTGCGDGYQFCDTGCDGLTCGCSGGSCDNYLEGCFQFRYGQCNQDVSCLGRIKCRVVTCVPPWEVDPSCTMTNAEDDGTANQNSSCLTPGPTPPPPPTPPKPACDSPQTECKTVGIAMSTDSEGYGIVTSYGKYIPFGDEGHGGVGYTLEYPIVAVAGCRLGGHWLVNSQGRIFAYGNAEHYGSAVDNHLDAPISAMAATASGRGYWLITRRGHLHAYGDAQDLGTPDPANNPSGVIGIAGTQTGAGYWMVTGAGLVLHYGDAAFHGDLRKVELEQPIVGITSTPTAEGYWLVKENGGIYQFGDADFYGHATNRGLTHPVVGMARTVTGKGYVIAAADGRVLNYGDAVWYGSAFDRGES